MLQFDGSRYVDAKQYHLASFSTRNSTLNTSLRKPIRIRMQDFIQLCDSLENCGLVVPNFLRLSSLCLHTSQAYFPPRKVRKLLSSRENGVWVGQVKEEFWIPVSLLRRLKQPLFHDLSAFCRVLKVWSSGNGTRSVRRSEKYRSIGRSEIQQGTGASFKF